MFPGSYGVRTTEGDMEVSVHRIERTRYIPSTAAANLGRKKPKRSRLVQSSKATSNTSPNHQHSHLHATTEPPIDPKTDVTTIVNPNTRPEAGTNLLLLPLEIHEKILENLPYEEHFTLAQVCKIWMEVLQTDKFAVKRYRTIRVGQPVVLKTWVEPTLSERYQRATTNFLLYNEKLFLEMYRDEPNTATLIIADKANDPRIISREERVLRKRRDQAVNVCQELPLNHKYVEIHKLALFERDTMFFVGQSPNSTGNSRDAQAIYFSTICVNIHNYARIRNPPEAGYMTVPDIFCSGGTTLKGLMEGINKHVKKYVLDEYERVCGCVAFFSFYSKSGGSDLPGLLPGVVVKLLVFVVEPQDQNLYVKNGAGYYTAQLENPSAAESFNFGFSSSRVSFQAPKKTTKKAMSEISGQGIPGDSVNEEPFKAVLGDMGNLFI
ncbi:hypothetical protein TWF718_008477 [Orbilia javanica]|uniref:F-box domain-containing protein n=1 Tax=Orbilia javanica TaxID=47235 RepID=A0AAN8MWV9_9PEZI